MQCSAPGQKLKRFTAEGNEEVITIFGLRGIHISMMSGVSTGNSGTLLPLDVQIAHAYMDAIPDHVSSLIDILILATGDIFGPSAKDNPTTVKPLSKSSMCKLVFCIRARMETFEINYTCTNWEELALPDLGGQCSHKCQSFVKRHAFCTCAIS